MASPGPLNFFGDMGMAGGQDVAPNPMQNDQICINFYVEVDQQNPKEVVGLLGCPGLVELVADPAGGAPGFTNTQTEWPAASAVTNLPVRGVWELPGGNQALAIIANKCYLVTAYSAKVSTFATLTLTYVGMLLTSSGPVSIRDNNAGGYAVIVDGPYGYLYRLDGTASSTTSNMYTAGGTSVASASQSTSTGLFTTATQAFSAGDIVSIQGTPPTGFTTNTNYYVIATGLTTTACELSATLGGAAIVPTVSSACSIVPFVASNVLTFNATPNYKMIIGATVTDSAGYIPAGTTITAVDYFGAPPTITISNNTTGASSSDTVTSTLPVWTQIFDPAFLGATRVAYIDGWWVFNKPGSQTFYTNYPAYGIAFSGTYFALKDAYSDNLLSVMEHKEMLWLIGDKTTEIWYDAGGANFPFSRLTGTLIQAGCMATASVARICSSEGVEGLIWLGRDERGENKIIHTQGFQYNVVSSPAFSAEVSQYPVTYDAIGYTYQEDTHEFYVLTFPTADTTWCYDTQSGLLHKRLSYDPYTQQYHRHRSNCYMNFKSMRIVGDYQNGALYQMTRDVQNDAGWPLLAQRRSPPIWDKGQRGRVFMASLQLDFSSGVGNSSGLGSAPQCSLAISRDGGKTFGQRTYRPIGQAGKYKTRTMWRRLGFSRDCVVDLQVIDPVKRDLIGVTLKAFSSA